MAKIPMICYSCENNVETGLIRGSKTGPPFISELYYRCDKCGANWLHKTEVTLLSDEEYDKQAPKVEGY